LQGKVFLCSQNQVNQQLFMPGQNQYGYMFDIIASSFFQKRSCRLPGIGNLELAYTPAQYDFGSRQIKAPRETILFIASSPYDNHFNEFSAISQLIKDELEKNGSVEITGLGSFTKDSSGGIQFEAFPQNEDFLQPVIAEKVIHKDAEHVILVGDKETTNVVMNEYYSEDTTEVKDRWWIWAAVLGAIAITVIAVYLMNGFNNLASKTIF
jgi:nucleoid DNA-binding protein